MRDPDRIARIIKKLWRMWEKHPDWRLGQLVSNLMGPGPHDVIRPAVIFYLEDNVWEKLLDELLKENLEKHQQLYEGE